jgi:hypothetical protein
MQSKPLLWKYWIGLAIAVLGTFYICTIYATSSFHIVLSPITNEDRQKFAALAKFLETAERYPHREVDNTSVGFPASEDQLHVVGQLVDVFQLKFGRPPASIDELIALPGEGSRREQAKEEIRSESRNCRIFNLSAESYFLNCDGWSPNEKTLQDLNVAADKRYVRFYNFDGHAVLFAPPPYAAQP